jgi:hypothetical protein
MTGRGIPTLGFPTRTAAAVALKAQRLGNAEIGRRMGITAAQVSSLLISHERQEARAANTPAIVVPVAVLKSLDTPARKRGLSAHQLARRLLETISEHHLTDAILDDADQQTEAA